MKHRNSQKRIYFEDAVYFVTSVTRNRYPYFKEKIFADVFVKNLRMSKVLKQFRLYGWFLGYDHFHALIQPGDEYSISEVMRSLKTNSSRSINRLIHMSEGEVAPPRLRVGNHDKFGHPRLHGVNGFAWQSSYHDHIIRDGIDFENHFEYIQFNPEKHDLPADWPYVSENPKFIDLIDDYEG